MKKILLSLLVIFGFAGYAVYQRMSSMQMSVLPSTSQPSETTAPVPSPTPSPTPAAAPPPPPASKALYKNGSYTGSVTDAFFGPFQVKAVISNGKISDIAFLQYPNDRPTSTQINKDAMSAWKQEAIQAQSAQVDIVSGATQSSEAFAQSLASALTKAKN